MVGLHKSLCPAVFQDALRSFRMVLAATASKTIGVDVTTDNVTCETQHLLAHPEKL